MSPTSGPDDSARPGRSRLEGLSERFQGATGEGPLDDAKRRLGPWVKTVSRTVNVRKARISSFPFTAPTWPDSIEPEPPRSELGSNYDTDWARRPAARATRTVLQRGLMKPGVGAIARPNIEGLDRLAACKAPVIFVANHHSHLDIFLVLSSIPDRFRRKTVVTAGADYFFDKRWKATLSALALSAIPMERQRVSRTSADQALDLLKRDWNLVIFPEGSRSTDGYAGEFKPGAAFLAVKRGCTVVPIHLEGTDRVLPKGQNIPKPGETTVTFGHPIIPVEGEDARELNVRIERGIAQLGDEQEHGWWAARRRAADGVTPSLQGPAAVSWRRQWERSGREARRKPAKRSWP
jgi:1-acyl-sn-glycerol-3-phosphate acyltransferase